jgi:hypothetical protein
MMVLRADEFGVRHLLRGASADNSDCVDSPHRAQAQLVHLYSNGWSDQSRNSGGVLVNSRGQLIGINIFIISDRAPSPAPVSQFLRRLLTPQRCN